MSEGSQGEASDPFAPEKEKESVFTPLLKTLTFSNGYKNDGKDPSFKLLNKAGMASSTAMANLESASQQQRVTGNSSYLDIGTSFRTVQVDDILQVDGIQSETVMKDASHLYKANFLRGVSGNDHLRVNQTQDIIVLGESTAQYALKHEVTAPEEFEWKSTEGSFSLFKLDTMGTGIDLHGANAEFYGANAEAGVATAEGSVFSYEIPIAHEKESAVMSREGFEIDALVRLDTLPDLGLGTPFR